MAGNNSDFTFPVFKCTECGRANSVTGKPPAITDSNKNDMTKWTNGMWVCVPVKCPFCAKWRVRCRHCQYNIAGANPRYAIKNMKSRHQNSRNCVGLINMEQSSKTSLLVESRGINENEAVAVAVTVPCGDNDY